MLGAVRPSSTRRSWWLREALATEAASAPHLARAASPLRGTTTADVVIVGGGYTGLWTALRITELEPGARVVLVEERLVAIQLAPVERHEVVIGKPAQQQIALETAAITTPMQQAFPTDGAGLAHCAWCDGGDVR